MEKTKEYDQQILNKIARLIKPEYLESAKLELMIKTDNSNKMHYHGFRGDYYVA